MTEIKFIALLWEDVQNGGKTQRKSIHLFMTD